MLNWKFKIAIAQSARSVTQAVATRLLREPQRYAIPCRIRLVIQRRHLKLLTRTQLASGFLFVLLLSGSAFAQYSGSANAPTYGVGKAVAVDAAPQRRAYRL